MSKIIFVHGASSTPESFNFICQNLPEHERINFKYDSSIPLEYLVEEFIGFVEPGHNYQIVAHSLGGLVATAASYALPSGSISRMAIMSTPFAGSKAAGYLKWLFPKYGLFDSVADSNSVVLTIQNRGAIVPTLTVITSGGEIPLIKGPNDGVVSVDSQVSLRNCEKKIFRLNHFEVLLSYDVVKAIKEYLWQSA